MMYMPILRAWPCMPRFGLLIEHLAMYVFKHPYPCHILFVCLCVCRSGDVQYISRLVRLVRHYVPACVLTESEHSHGHFYHGKVCLLSFDKFYEKNGEENLEKTTLVRHWQMQYTHFSYLLLQFH